VTVRLADTGRWTVRHSVQCPAASTLALPRVPFKGIRPLRANGRLPSADHHHRTQRRTVQRRTPKTVGHQSDAPRRTGESPTLRRVSPACTASFPAWRNSAPGRSHATEQLGPTLLRAHLSARVSRRTLPSRVRHPSNQGLTPLFHFFSSATTSPLCMCSNSKYSNTCVHELATF
jgi:hypothetical protein